MEPVSNPLRVLAISHDVPTEACSYARIITPLHALGARGLVEYRYVRVLPWRIGAFRQVLRDMPRWDLVWMARPRHSITLPIIRQARHLSIPILIDLDDWLLDVPPGHPDAPLVGSRPRRETLRTALRAADAITVSTPALAARCAALGLQVHVLPNAIDCRLFARIPRRDGPLTLAFAGSPTHRPDMSLIGPPLRRVLTERPGSVRVVTVGCPIEELCSLDGYTHYERVSAADYPALLSSLRVDIGLAPLHDTPFNRAKSDIKYLEYSAVGAATVASSVAPYQESIEPDRGVLVRPNTQDAWHAALLRLLDQPETRHHLAENAYDWVRNQRSIEVTADRWYAVMRDYANRPGLGPVPGAQQLAPGRFERVLANIMLRQVPYYGREMPRLAMRKAQAELRKRLT